MTASGQPAKKRSSRGNSQRVAKVGTTARLSAPPLATHHAHRIALHLVETLRDFPRVGEPCLGQADTVLNATERPDAGKRLRPGNLAPHPAVGQEQLGCRTGKVLVPCRP